VRAHVTGQERIEPLVANGNPLNANPDKANCADDLKQAGNLQFGAAAGTLTGLARTEITPDGGPTNGQSIAAESRVENVSLANGGITVGLAEASAAASCTGLPPTAGRVAAVTIGSTTIALDPLAEGLETITAGPLGSLIKVEANKTIVEATATDFATTRRALELTVIEGAGALGFSKLILGEAKIDSHNNPCFPLPPPTLGACPPGSSVDPVSGLCVITQIQPGGPPCPLPSFEQNGQCVRLIPVLGPGFSIGGFIVPLGEIRSALARPCRSRRFGSRQFAIVGTNRADRITGTNRADRIFTLAGNDRVSGGRGNDCIDAGRGKDVAEGGGGHDSLLGRSASDILNGGSGRDMVRGGTGNDRQDGGSGADRMFGDQGRDRLSGDLGNDRIWGGTGKDFINGGNGRVRLFGGKGNDEVNGSTAGPAARINCGPGRDVVRVNQNERRRARSCERLLVIRRPR
jgi:hypothetical protein